MHGIAILDKPAGISSAKALNGLKQDLGRGVKVGHAGTLDPFATGILIALCGDATRLSDIAMALSKEYVTTVRFGWQTDTLDPEGEIVAEADPGAERTLDLAPFQGIVEQMPPAYSALKVDGRRAYDLARKGETPELKPRRVRIDSIEILESNWPDVTLRIRCGAGTYIRAIGRDLGASVNLPASLTALRRTAIGPFREARNASMLELIRAAEIPELELHGDDARRFVVGQTRPCGSSFDGRVAVLHEGRLLGLGEARKSLLRASSVLAAARRDLEAGQV